MYAFEFVLCNGQYANATRAGCVRGRAGLKQLSFSGNFDVFCLQPNGRVSRTTVQDLLPFAFSKDTLAMGVNKAE